MKPEFFAPSFATCAAWPEENCSCKLAFKNIFTLERSLIDEEYEPFNYNSPDFTKNTLNMQIYGRGSNILTLI